MSIVAFDNQLNCIECVESKRTVLNLVKEIEKYGELTSNLLYSLPVWTIYKTQEWKKFEKSSDYILKFVYVYL